MALQHLRMPLGICLVLMIAVQKSSSIGLGLSVNANIGLGIRPGTTSGKEGDQNSGWSNGGGGGGVCCGFLDNKIYGFGNIQFKQTKHLPPKFNGPPPPHHPTHSNSPVAYTPDGNRVKGFDGSANSLKHTLGKNNNNVLVISGGGGGGGGSSSLQNQYNGYKLVNNQPQGPAHSQQYQGHQGGGGNSQINNQIQHQQILSNILSNYAPTSYAPTSKPDNRLPVPQYTPAHPFQRAPTTKPTNYHHSSPFYNTAHPFEHNPTSKPENNNASPYYTPAHPFERPPEGSHIFGTEGRYVSGGPNIFGPPVSHNSEGEYQSFGAPEKQFGGSDFSSTNTQTDGRPTFGRTEGSHNFETERGQFNNGDAINANAITFNKPEKFYENSPQSQQNPNGHPDYSSWGNSNYQYSSHDNNQLGTKRISVNAFKPFPSESTRDEMQTSNIFKTTEPVQPVTLTPIIVNDYESKQNNKAEEQKSDKNFQYRLFPFGKDELMVVDDGVIKALETRKLHDDVVEADVYSAKDGSLLRSILFKNLADRSSSSGTNGQLSTFN